MRLRLSRVTGVALAAATMMVSGALGMGCYRGFGETPSEDRLDVAITGGNRGTSSSRIGLTFSTPATNTLTIRAFHGDGSLDTSFSGYVRLSVKPGVVSTVSGPNAVGRNVRLINGVAENVTVGLLAAYGDARIWAEDMGYFPVDPNAVPPPQCSDGIDNNGNGLIDFPADPGCAFANDDSEDGGTLATGTSPTLYYAFPRVYDVRGGSQGGTGTSFPHEQVAIDTGYGPNAQGNYVFQHSVVVTRISTDGFYVTDIDDTRGFNSVFAYNFSAPANLGVCDRLTSLSGTSSDFFGFTELNFPTWSAEPYVVGQRPCMVPEPYLFSVQAAGPFGVQSAAAVTTKLRETASLVRAWTGDVLQADDPAPHPHTLHVATHFGSGYPKAPAYPPTNDASNCDLNGDGTVDFNTNPEKACGLACEADVECAEWSAYAARGDFMLVLHDNSSNANAQLQANGSSTPTFDAASLRGKPIKSFTGTLRYFSGGQQFTIEARCSDDIVIDMNKKPLASDKACVTQTSGENPEN